MIDHSLTYRKKTIRNIPHILRLQRILKMLSYLSPNSKESYLDIGCSNGYITEIIRNKFNLGASQGMDHTIENLELARERYPEIRFDFIDLNRPPEDGAIKYKLITCFETLEHVGHLDNAVSNILSYGSMGSKILISVPIEVGFIGTIKFLIKTIVFNYSLGELPSQPSWRQYLQALLSGKRISKLRNQREGWGTHFGFDYRDVDDILDDSQVKFKALNSFSTRFYIINK